MKKTVVLFHPKVHPTSSYCQIPLGILAVAGPLEKAGYRLKLIDAMVEKDYEDQVIKSSRKAVCLGISCMTGYQIHDGLRVAKLVKKKYPRLPIIWGGWHPSVESSQTIANPVVDVVIRGQGERTMLEIVSRLEKNLSLKKILGISYKNKGKIIENPDRAFEDVNNFPPLPYHLVELEKYILNIEELGTRVINYISSRGCCFKCRFCAEFRVNKRRWSGLKQKRVVDELELLVTKYHLNGVIFNDSNFFVDKERVRQISKELIKRKLNIKWGKANGHPRQLLTYDDALWKLMKKSGLQSILIGAESGSQRILNLIDKQSTVAEIVRLAKICKRHQIKIWYSFIVGFFPDPEKDQLDKTLALIKKVRLINNNCEILVFFYTPYPGTPLYDRALKLGLKEPKLLEEWSMFSLDEVKPTLIKKTYQKKLEPLINFYFPLAYRQEGLRLRMRKSYFSYLIYEFFHQLAYFRCFHNFFFFPWEWHLYQHFGKRLSFLY